MCLKDLIKSNVDNETIKLIGGLPISFIVSLSIYNSFIDTFYLKALGYDV